MIESPGLGTGSSSPQVYPPSTRPLRVYFCVLFSTLFSTVFVHDQMLSLRLGQKTSFSNLEIKPGTPTAILGLKLTGILP